MSQYMGNQLPTVTFSHKDWVPDGDGIDPETGGLGKEAWERFKGSDQFKTKYQGVSGHGALLSDQDYPKISNAFALCKQNRMAAKKVQVREGWMYVRFDPGPQGFPDMEKVDIDYL